MSKSTPLTEELGARLLEARLAAGCTFREWARAIETSEYLLDGLENGKKEFSTFRIIKICKRLRIRAEWLLMGHYPIFTNHPIEEISDPEILIVKDKMSKRLEEVRVSSEWKNQEMMADWLGMPVKYYKLLEKGNTKFSLNRIIYICKRLSISPDWFILGEGPMVLDKEINNNGSQKHSFSSQIKNPVVVSLFK